MVNDFATWLNSELERRRWTGADLAERAGTTSATVSNVLNRKRGVGLDFCNGVALAFGVPPEVIYRRAGLLPALPDEPDHEQFQLLTDYYNRLPSHIREELIEYAVFKYEREVKERPVE